LIDEEWKFEQEREEQGPVLSEIILDEDAVTADLGSLRLENEVKLRLTSDVKALNEAYTLKRQEILDDSYLIEDYVE
jgi:hypothetical protein